MQEGVYISARQTSGVNVMASQPPAAGFNAIIFVFEFYDLEQLLIPIRWIHNKKLDTYYSN